MRSETPAHEAQFPRAAFAGVVCLTLILIGLFATSSWKSRATIQSIESNELAIERACGAINHLDEVLTMSARMGAATGDPRWEQRYEAHVPILDEAIATAERLAPIRQETEGSHQTKLANDRLVELELEAFELVRDGRAEAAAALLSSATYEDYKQVYSAGNQLYLASMRGRVSDVLAAERARGTREWSLLSVLVVVLALMWWRVGRSIREHSHQRSASEVRLRATASELERKNAEVSKATRVKSEFLARMSHEIRTPMNGVLGIAEILSHTELDAEQRSFVETIVSSGNLLESVLNDILDFSKIEAGMLKIAPIPSDPRAIARDVERTFGQRARSNRVELECQVDEGVPASLVLDPVRVRQVLLNLVGNAIKFSEGGSVRLHIGPGPDPEAIVCTVTDTGVGIPADRLAAVFEGFVQASGSTGQQYGGTGLGLTICRELTRAMGGRIEVESEVGAGTTFTVHLPAPLPGPGSALPKRSGTTKSVHSQARVLVAEDNAVNQLVARRMLERLGCRVAIAADGETCVRMHTEGDYDLVLMDLSMPVMGGLDAARAIRGLEPAGRRIPIVALTASAFPGDVEACKEADMDGFLSKPFRESELIEILDRWTDRAAATARD